MNTKDTQFKTLYKLHAEELYRFCYFRTHSKETSEDIVSDAFAELYKINSEKLENPRAWLFRVCRNIMYDTVFRTSIKKTATFEDNSVIEEVPEHIDVAQVALDEATVELIRSEIQKLDPTSSEIIVLKLWEEMSFKEIATVVEMQENAVKQRFYRGLESVKMSIDQNKNYKLNSFTLPILAAGIIGISKSSAFSLSTNLLSSSIMTGGSIASAAVATSASTVATGGLLATGAAKAAAIIVATGAITFGGIAGVSYVNNQDSAPSQEKETVNQITPIEDVKPVDFNGKYVSAKLPTGWSIIEQEGNLQSSKGLSNLSIMNNSNTLLAEVRFVYNPGGNQICQEYYKFSDSNPDDIISAANAYENLSGGSSMPIVSVNDFKQIRIFNTSFRNSGALYVTGEETENGFNLHCGARSNMLTDERLLLQADSENIGVFYLAVKSDSVDSTDSTKLFEVLESLSVKVSNAEEDSISVEFDLTHYTQSNITGTVDLRIPEWQVSFELPVNSTLDKSSTRYEIYLENSTCEYGHFYFISLINNTSTNDFNQKVKDALAAQGISEDTQTSTFSHPTLALKTYGSNGIGEKYNIFIDHPNGLLQIVDMQRVNEGGMGTFPCVEDYNDNSSTILLLEGLRIN